MTEDVRVVIDLALLLMLSGGLSILFARIKMPPILGYLGAGIVLGPTMLPELWVEGNTVSLLSSIGIVLLMFYIGLETDVQKLKATGSKILFIVGFEMPIVVAIGYLIGVLLGMSTVQAIFLGAIISGTSTAVVVGVLHASRHINSETARTIITITVFEDVGQVIILTMAAPLLAGDSPALGSTVNMILGMILFLSLAVVFGMALVPRLMNFIGGKYSSEILLIFSVGLCFTMAALSAEIGLSIAIGAFIMGMMISLSRYRQRLSSEVEPVKELFMAVFFISIGLQITPQLIFDNLLLAAIIAIAFMMAKVSTVWLGCYLTNMTARDSLLIATSLIAMGEFAFIIAKSAFDAGVVDDGFYSAVIGGALITMIAMPILAKGQPRMFDTIYRLTPHRLRGALSRIDEIHAAAAARNSKEQDPALKGVKRHLSLIFVDVMIALVVVIVFTSLERFTIRLEEATPDFILLPQELLMLLLIVVMSPIVYNMFNNVRNIAKVLAKHVLSSSREIAMNERTVYLVFANLGYIALLLVVLIIFIPFIPQLLFSPVGTIIVVMCAVLIVVLLWDTIHRTYSRFSQFMSTAPGMKKKDSD